MEGRDLVPPNEVGKVVFPGGDDLQLQVVLLAAIVIQLPPGRVLLHYLALPQPEEEHGQTGEEYYHTHTSYEEDFVLCHVG